MARTWMRRAAAAWLLMAPALAAADEPKGFFIFGDLLATEPADVDHLVGVLETTVEGPTPADPDAIRRGRLAFDYGADPSFRAGFGFDGGAGGRVTVSLWGYSEEQLDFRAVDENFFLSDSFNSTDYEGPFDLESGAKIDASSISVDFRKERRLGNDWTLTWKVGLRRVDYEESLRLIASNEVPNVPCGGFEPVVCNSGTDLRRLEADGVGVEVGVGGAYHFGNRTALVGDFSVSVVSGDSESERIRINPSGQTLTLGGREDVSGVITDLSTGVRVNLWRGLDLAVLIEFSSWDDLVTDFAASGENPFAEQTTPLRDNVTFRSGTVSLRYKFGKR